MWILRVEEPTVSHADLADSGDFLSLDVDLAAAVAQIATGELGREINTLIDESAQHKKLVKGRQLLLKVYQEHRTNEALGAVYDIQDFINIKWLGDAKMRTFLLNVDTVLLGCAKPIDPDEKRIIFFDKIKGSAKLRADLAYYRRLKPGDEDHSYTY